MKFITTVAVAAVTGVAMSQPAVGRDDSTTFQIQDFSCSTESLNGNMQMEFTLSGDHPSKPKHRFDPIKCIAYYPDTTMSVEMQSIPATFCGMDQGVGSAENSIYFSWAPNGSNGDWKLEIVRWYNNEKDHWRKDVASRIVPSDQIKLYLGVESFDGPKNFKMPAETKNTSPN